MRRLISLATLVLIPTLAFAAEMRGPAARIGGGRVMILDPAQTLTEADEAALAAKGIRVGQVLSGGRYVARVAEWADTADERVASLEAIEPGQKMHRSMRYQLGRGKTWLDVHVIFHRDIAFDEAREAILGAGGAMDVFKTRFSPSQRIDARIAPESLDALLADERVFVVAGARPWQVRSDNIESAKLSKVDVVQAPPYGLTGDGVTVSLFELGEGQASHPEFEGRLTVHMTGGSSSDKEHATHVAGTIAGAGLNPRARGMAPKARIHQLCVRTGGNGCKNDWLEDKDTQLPTLGVVADNNSWGYIIGWGNNEGGYPVWQDTEEYFGAYDLTVGAPLDDISNERNILFIHSAGNDARAKSFDSEWSEHRHVDAEGDTITDKLFCYSKNASGTDCPNTCTGGCEKVPHDANRPFDTLGVTAGAKNVIAVGNVAGTAGGTVVISSSSSRGPAKDGRVKPDVVARGQAVYSAWPTNTYQSISGTSMAAPAVTGIAALLVEQWRKTNAGASPNAAQLKALLIAGADDLGNPGPDYTYGFGLVNARNSVDLIIADRGKGERIRSFEFPQGEGTSFESAVVVPAAQNVRFVLQWPDKPIAWLGGDDIAEKALVNDLDLKVITPSGEVVLPYVLDRTQFQAHATRGVNTVDNTEMIEIANAAPGVYRVVATGTNVTEGPQMAVLVTSAGFAPPCSDPWEVSSNNDSPASAIGNLAANAAVTGAICAANDVDHFKFVATKTGPIHVTVTSGDTPLRASLATAAGVALATADVPPNTTRTLTTEAATVPFGVTLRIEATGAIGVLPSYTFVPQFGEEYGPRKRSVRK